MDEIASATSQKGHMSEEEQDNRRKQIREIMKDPNLSQQEKNKQVQSLMDGRRRSISSSGTQSVSAHSHSTHDSRSHSHHSNYVNAMAHAAAYASDYYSSDDEGDAIMSDAGIGAPEDIAYGYGYERNDERSVASSVTNTSYQSNNYQTPIPSGMSYRQVHGRSYSMQEFTASDRAAAAASTSIFMDNPAQISRLMEQSRPECQHYERNCTIVSPCCGLAFGCRICHDECPVLPKPLNQRERPGDHMMVDQLQEMKNKKMDRRRSMPLDLEEEENHHNIDRFAIREVICRQCYTRQTSKTNNCTSCGVQFGEYHCNICNLWMAKSESPYHCIDCGFCRVGGRENFRHCDDCGMCIDALLFDDHNCKAGKYMSNCPVCQEDLFSSRHASHEMPCGHAIHWHCFKELTSYDTRCPVCKKTAETPEHMASTWSAIAMGIALQPVPPDMARVVNIFCNDCEASDSNRRWHFLGVRCMQCLSFNTNVEQIVMQGRDAADFLDKLEASRSNESGVPTDIAISTTRNTSMEEDIPSAQETSSGSTIDFQNMRLS